MTKLVLQKFKCTVQILNWRVTYQLSICILIVGIEMYSLWTKWNLYLQKKLCSKCFSNVYFLNKCSFLNFPSGVLNIWNAPLDIICRIPHYTWIICQVSFLVNICRQNNIIILLSISTNKSNVISQCYLTKMLFSNVTAGTILWEMFLLSRAAEMTL